MEKTFPVVNTKILPEVRKAVTEIYVRLFPGASPRTIEDAFKWAQDCFAGEYADFQPIDAKYHDLEHTLQGTLALARLLEGYKKARATPELNQRMFELGTLAILLHDTGYLKRRGDTDGTGAKYTLVHVTRSADFAARLLKEKGFSPEEVRTVQNMIRCTGVNANLDSIPFQNELERRVGYALGTADLLGQMAADDYIDKLDILYLEFEESNHYNNKDTGPGVFTSAEDLRRKTPLFWQNYVLPKIEEDFLGLYRFLSRPPGEANREKNEYLERIRLNMARLELQLSGAL
jgi:hypothetical protein